MERPLINEIYQYDFIKEKVKHLKFDNKTNDGCLNISSNSSSLKSPSFFSNSTKNKNNILSNSNNSNKLFENEINFNNSSGNKNVKNFKTIEVKKDNNSPNSNSSSNLNMKSINNLKNCEDDSRNTIEYFSKKLDNQKHTKSNKNSSCTNSKSNSYQNINQNFEKETDIFIDMKDEQIAPIKCQIIDNNQNQLKINKEKFKQNTFNKEEKSLTNHFLSGNNNNFSSNNINIIDGNIKLKMTNKNNQNFSTKFFSDNHNIDNSNKLNYSKQIDLPSKAFLKERAKISKVYSPSLGINEMNDILSTMKINNEQIQYFGNTNKNSHNISVNFNLESKLLIEDKNNDAHKKSKIKEPKENNYSNKNLLQIKLNEENEQIDEDDLLGRMNLNLMNINNKSKTSKNRIISKQYSSNNQKNIQKYNHYEKNDLKDYPKSEIFNNKNGIKNSILKEISSNLKGETLYNFYDKSKKSNSSQKKHKKQIKSVAKQENKRQHHIELKSEDFPKNDKGNSNNGNFINVWDIKSPENQNRKSYKFIHQNHLKNSKNTSLITNPKISCKNIQYPASKSKVKLNNKLKLDYDINYQDLKTENLKAIEKNENINHNNLFLMIENNNKFEDKIKLESKEEKNFNQKNTILDSSKNKDSKGLKKMKENLSITKNTSNYKFNPYSLQVESEGYQNIDKGI